MPSRPLWTGSIPRTAILTRPCPDCGHDLSRLATTCPWCGRPLDPSAGAGAPPAPATRATTRGPPALALVAAAGGVLALALAVGAARSIVRVSVDASADVPRVRRVASTPSVVVTVATAPRGAPRAAAAATGVVAPPRAVPDPAVYVRAPTHVRAGPSTRTRIVRTAARDERLAIARIEGGWLALADGSGWVHSSRVRLSTEQQLRASATLELLDWSGARVGRSAFRISGQVRNRSDGRIDDLAVVVDVYDDDGTFVTSGFGPATTARLPPGGATAFAVALPRDPRSRDVRIRFTSADGRTIDHFYDEP